MIDFGRRMFLTSFLLISFFLQFTNALKFLQPTNGTTFSSTDSNTIIFSSGPSDPPLIDLYIFSSSITPFGPSQLRLLASSVNSSIGHITFTSQKKDRVGSNSSDGDVLPPSSEPIYSVVAVKSGEKNALENSPLFNVVKGPVSNTLPKDFDHAHNASIPDPTQILSVTSSNNTSETTPGTVSSTSQSTNSSNPTFPVPPRGSSIIPPGFNPLPPGFSIGGIGDQQKFAIASKSVSISTHRPTLVLIWTITILMSYLSN
ncbi:secreted protein [Melampsora americana]|nr:secreted protein [Melampsora americana]